VKTVALCSARGAPGVTTTALLLAARLEGAVLVEADLTGGVVAVRYGLGREPGLVSLAASNPARSGGWLDHAQDAGGVAVLVGPDSGEAAEALWRSAGERIASVLARSDGWAVVDGGGVWRRAPLVDSADLAVVVIRPVAEQVVSAAHAVGTLRRSTRGELAVVLAGDGPYRSGDVADALGYQVLAHLPDDPVTAEHLRDGGASSKAVGRSRLARAVVALGDVIETRLATAPTSAHEAVLSR
jgi:MinD-like ATPase involved in chromosome partitioning or flagellar assembly